jgi:biopolymer transport protein ExbD
MPSITVVSLIDILAILLIFFIVTTTFREKLPQLQINLPESRSAAKESAQPKKPVVLQIKENDKITLGEKSVTLAELPGVIRETLRTQPGCSITMKADKEAPFGTVVSVLDALQEAGIKNIPAMTRPHAP